MADRLAGLDPQQRAEQSRWMARIAAGGADGEAALGQVFKAYERRTVLRLCSRYGLDESEAQDVWQDAVFDLWKGAARFRPGADLAPWLQTLANNRALKLLDSAWRRHRSDLQDDDGASLADDEGDASAVPSGPEQNDASVTPSLAASLGAPDANPRNVDADECTDLGLRRFEARYPREAGWLLARHFDGRDVPSLAAEMGCNEATARQRLHALRQKLKPFLQHCVQLLDA